MTRRSFLACVGLAVIGVVGLSRPTLAHHGWGWATDEEFELTGRVLVVRLGNPHGEMTIDVDGEEWVVEIGQPWRNERAGLTPVILGAGVVVTVYGHRSARSSERLVKAERVIIAGREYNLYPDRAS